MSHGIVPRTTTTARRASSTSDLAARAVPRVDQRPADAQSGGCGDDDA